MRMGHAVLALGGTLFLAGVAKSQCCDEAWCGPPSTAFGAGSPQAVMSGDETYYFDLFAHAARYCPLDSWREVIDTVREISAGEFDLESAEALYADLGMTLPRLRLAWDEDGLDWLVPPAPVATTLGLPRCVLVEVENQTPQVHTFKAYFVDPRDSNNATTDAGGTRGMLTPLTVTDAAQTEVALLVRSGVEVRSIPLPVAAEVGATVLGTLVDEGEFVAGRVWASGSDGHLRFGGQYADNETVSLKPIAPPGFNRKYRLPFFYADGSFEVQVPAGWVELTLERGFEHHRVTRRVFVEPGEVRRVLMAGERMTDLTATGWYSGETHTHWVENSWSKNESLELLAVVQRAEDVRVVNNLTLRQLSNGTGMDFIKPDHAPMGPIPGYDTGDYLIQMGEEYRNSPFYAHLCFLNLTANPPSDPTGLVMPISTGDEMGKLAEDYPVNASRIAIARAQSPAESRPIVTAAHGIAGSAAAEIALGLIDSLDQIDPLDYYRVLDCGFRLPITDGADHPARVLGETRCYVRVEGPFSYGAWIDGILAGATFATSGPLLLFEVSGAGPGEELAVTGGEPLSVTLEARSRDPLGRVQILFNGQLVYDEVHAGTEALVELPYTATESGWWVARSSSAESPRYRPLGERNAAHTSALYQIVDSKPIFNDTGAAENLRDRCQGGAEFVEQQALFYSPDPHKKLAEALSVFQRGRDVYQTLIDLHK